jgi:CRISPR/Cas system type I-B associated protein Csh2 (Cas7 group RAMP superfamily)
MKHEVTYTVKGFAASFKDEVVTKTGSTQEVCQELNKICKETFHSDRAVVRDVLLMVQK